MRNLLKQLGFSAAVIGAVVCGTDAVGVESGRAGYNVTRMNRAGMSSSQRMPTMPTLPVNTVGNVSMDLPQNPVPGPGVPGTAEPGVGDEPGNPDVPDVPEPVVPECPDGGVKNSEYTVDKCMNDVFYCVNNGALPNGINDLFNEELFHSIVNGMNLCSTQVDKCIAQVRRNCDRIYRVPADVWLDFNARKIQPEYYSFVLRKTGLTPSQAENTCMLLDKNTYGASFNAVASANGLVTSEYNNRVGAYNGQGGNGVIKVNPQGATVNNGNGGVDGARGHYARWDATNAECYLRVAAYNKNTPIKNSWLFGIAGDDRLAEVWQPAGSTFSCNKDLFGFSLYNNTSTVAVVGIGGGTLVGAGVGALAGHGTRSFDCGIKSHRENLLNALQRNYYIGILNEYLSDDISATTKELSVAQCNEIVTITDTYNQLSTAADACTKTKSTVVIDIDTEYTITVKGNSYSVNLANLEADMQAQFADKDDDAREYLNLLVKELNKKYNEAGFETCPDKGDVAECLAKIVGMLNAYASSEACRFKPFNKAIYSGQDIYCNATSGISCIDAGTTKLDLERFEPVYAAIIPVVGKVEKSNRLKTTLIGAGVGAGAGGLATAITAFVEKGNINCRVGDGLEQVANGKSHSIGTLHDFYVKWNLRLPETVAPTASASDCESWRRACSDISDLNQCKAMQINYKPADAPAITLVHSACMPSGSACIENYAVAKSFGACLANGAIGDVPNVPVALPVPGAPIPAGAVAAPQPVVDDNVTDNNSDASSEKLWYQTWNSPM